MHKKIFKSQKKEDTGKRQTLKQAKRRLEKK